MIKTATRQLISGCILLGIIIITGSLQVTFSPFVFVRGIMIIAVIGCSMAVGAFVRELFILKKQRRNR